MALAAAAAPQLVPVIFGPQWKPAIPIAQVLALAGAVQAIYRPTTAPLVLGLGHGKLNLRYAWLMTVATTVGVIAGLPFGPLGVAVGYSVATGLLIPVEWLIRRHLLGTTIREQIDLVGASRARRSMGCRCLHVIAAAMPGHPLVVLTLGTVLAFCAGAAVLRLAHRVLLAELIHMATRAVGRGSPHQESPP